MKELTNSKMKSKNFSNQRELSNNKTTTSILESKIVSRKSLVCIKPSTVANPSQPWSATLIANSSNLSTRNWDIKWMILCRFWVYLAIPTLETTSVKWNSILKTCVKIIRSLVTCLIRWNKANITKQVLVRWYPNPKNRSWRISWQRPNNDSKTWSKKTVVSETKSKSNPNIRAPSSPTARHATKKWKFLRGKTEKTSKNYKGKNKISIARMTNCSRWRRRSICIREDVQTCREI